MPKKTRISPYYTEKIIEFYARIFESASAGITIVGEAFPDLYLQTLRELTGKFTEGELKMLIDIYNGHILTGAGIDGIHCMVADSFDCYPQMYEDKWGVDKKAMLKKTDSLTVFQRACLEIWAVSFWHGDYEAEKAIENHCWILEK